MYFQILFSKFENTHNWWAEHGVREGGGREKRILKKKEKRKKTSWQNEERDEAEAEEGATYEGRD